MIVNGLNKCVTEMSVETKENRNDEIGDLLRKQDRNKHQCRCHLFRDSRWTKSQTLRAKTRVILNPTAMHWRDQSFKYDLGCNAGKPHRRLLERWRRPRSIRFVDRFHTIHHIGRKTSRRIYMVRGSACKEANNIQATSLVATEMEKHVRCSATKVKAKVGYRKKTEVRQCEKVERCLFHWPTDAEFKETVQKRTEKVGSSDASSHALQDQEKRARRKTCSSSGTRRTKYACIVEGDESSRKRLEGTLHKDHEDHIAGKGNNSLNHYNHVHKFIPMP